MQATQTTYTKLVDSTGGARDHYHVPKYQREYTWGKPQWERLLMDIYDNPIGYFMGSIICVLDGQSAAPGSELVFEVIDGQQRLTTITLLLAAIYHKLKLLQKSGLTIDQDDIDRLSQELQTIRARLVKTSKTAFVGTSAGITIGSKYYLLRVQPSTQRHNKEDLLYILNQIDIIEKYPYPTQHGNRLFAKAYKYFNEHTPSTFEELEQLINRINQLIFVQITVPNQADAFALFESLNNRGIPLSAMDIIKNKILSQLEQKHNVPIDDAYEQWQRLIEAIPEANDQERFLRHFYNALKVHREINVDGITRAIQSQVIRIYETLIQNNAPQIFNNLIKAAEIYGKVLSATYKPTLNQSLVELERIGSAPAYMVLLYIFMLNESDIENPDYFYAECINFLCKYFIRRNVTDSPPTRQIDLAMIKIINACDQYRTQGNKISIDFFVKQLKTTGELAQLETFAEALNGSIYESNNAITRYLLIQLDVSFHTKEYNPDLWQRDNKHTYVWTVEHILPQTEELNRSWIDMIGGGNTTVARDVQEKVVHTLGNLTLSAYNSKLSARPFVDKQVKTSERPINGQVIYTGFLNGLALNKLVYKVGVTDHSLSTAPEWSQAHIESRTKAMVSLLIDANRFPEE